MLDKLTSFKGLETTTKRGTRSKEIERDSSFEQLRKDNDFEEANALSAYENSLEKAYILYLKRRSEVYFCI